MIAKLDGSSPRKMYSYQYRWKKSKPVIDLNDALERLRQATDRVDASGAGSPINVRLLVELLQTQTQMIEALALHQQVETPKRRRCRAGELHDGSNQDKRLKSVNDLNTDPPTSKPHRRPQWITYPVSNEHKKPVRRVSCRRSREQAQRLKPLSYVRSCQPTRSTKIQDFQPLMPQETELLSLPEAVVSLVSSCPSTPTSPVANSPPISTSTPPSCAICSTQLWHPVNRPSPLTHDLNFESRTQEAFSTLIAAMKAKKRTPVGLLDNSTFHLHSSTYRQSYYCAHDRFDRQSLIIYSKSATWETDFPGIPPPGVGEVAMELVVYPDCLLIVRPFLVPRYASWKWYTLDAIGDDARPTTIEAMFLGNGVLKLRVRLSELLGRRRMKVGETDRCIEFAGVWAEETAATGVAV